MEREVTKKVRLSRSEAARLRGLAQKKKTSESDVLREGLDLVERRQSRAEGFEALIQMIDGPPPKKTRLRLR